MKLTALNLAMSALLAVPTLAAPAPEPLEITMSIGTEQSPHPQSTIPQTASAVFHGADPQAWYGSALAVDGKSHDLDNKLSVSYITLQGFAGCVFGGVDGSKTYVKSYGIPATVPVGPPQTQVKYTCKDPNAPNASGLQEL